MSTAVVSMAVFTLVQGGVFTVVAYLLHRAEIVTDDRLVDLQHRHPWARHPSRSMSPYPLPR